MILIVLAFLGVPLWIVAGALLAVLLSRRRFRNRPDAFEAKVRLHSGAFTGMDASFPRSAASAIWAQNVLIIFHGMARTRVLLLPTLALDQDTHSLPDVKGVGPEPCGVTLRLDNGALVEVAASGDARMLLSGPYGVTHEG